MSPELVAVALCSDRKQNIAEHGTIAASPAFSGRERNHMLGVLSWELRRAAPAGQDTSAALLSCRNITRHRTGNEWVISVPDTCYVQNLPRSSQPEGIAKDLTALILGLATLVASLQN